MEALLIIGFGLVIYFTPWIIAAGRSHPNTVAIFVLNLFLGWSGIGWIAALIWSFTTPAKPVIVAAPAPVPAPSPQPIEAPSVDPVAVRLSQLERLAKLKAEGALTDQEYEQQKRQLLS
ncbi:superinfection immunity protein [Pseudomonas sp. AOB-7]|uniref:superinfection immunity protein n=1 Tax=Pseudomonas sp. AOB-7 TaxID=2482750 RepID=UPI000EFAB06C|nr:superinfection immunity protein [Pseudomonas sp. AOB-7]RMH85224.1 superinfection immunity protein [Pseudomonas sp. AOB-7]